MHSPPIKRKGRLVIKADICMLVDNFATHDSRVVKEATSLSRAGWRVVLLAVGKDAPADLPMREVMDGITILRADVAPSSIDRLIWKPLSYLLALIGLPLPLFMRTSRRWTRFGRSVNQLLRQVDAQIYHAHDYPALVALDSTQRPVVYDAHELYFDRHDSHPRGLKAWLVARKHAMERQAERQLAQHLAGFITVGDLLADQLARTLNVARPVVVKNAVDTRYMPPAVVTLDQGRLIGHAGIFLDDRHLEEMVAALDYLPDDVRLMLIGDGHLRNRLLAQAQRSGTDERLIMLSMVAPDQVAPILAQVAVSLILIADQHLSYRYSLPNKFFESVAAGVPVISSAIPEVAALIRQHDLGIVIDDPSSPQAIAEAVLRAIEPQENQRLRANVEQARRVLNWEAEEAKLISLYQRLLKQAE